LKGRTKEHARLTGGVLAYSELLRRLEAGELFSPGTWRPEQLRGAAYEVRLASDLMFIRGSGGESTKYGSGEYHPDPIILNEGEVALVSSVERCRFPGDLAANISIKWDLARKGLLVLTGGFVNPRFGLTRIDDRWEPKDDERLHFLVVNLGSEPQALVPGETRLASVQFLSMIGSPGEQVAPSTQAVIAREYAADAPVAALAVFHELRRQRRRLDRLNASYEKLEHGFQPLLTFGLYILAVTFLG
jgi:deoxycytidine triphosphate deaminase